MAFVLRIRAGIPRTACLRQTLGPLVPKGAVGNGYCFARPRFTLRFERGGWGPNLPQRGIQAWRASVTASSVWEGAMKITIVCAAVTALAVCGCSAQAARDPAPAQATSTAMSAATTARVSIADLEGTSWRFVEVAGMPVPAGVTATMQFRAGQASGKAGCNAYNASYRIAADGAAHFRQGISTKMACLTPAGAMRVEHGVFAALRETTKVALDDGQLLMLDAAGKPVAILVRDDAQ